MTPDPARVTLNKPRQITSVFSDLCRSPNGPRDRQLLHGEDLTVLGEADGHAYVRAARDGYVGFVSRHALGTPQAATHYVSAPWTHAYEAADFKSRDIIGLCHLSRITALSETSDHIEVSQGFIPKQHLALISHWESDPAKVAPLYLCADYLWGGNTTWGIDCSGLVQATLRACGIACPGDSDQQMTLGAPATGVYKRNDLLFWKGHVALVTDAGTLIHANANAMAVTYEPIVDAIARIAASDSGPVTAHRRL